MNRYGRSAVLLSLSAITLRLVWSGGFGWFVQQHMRIPLLLGALALLVLGAVEAVDATRAERRDPESARRPAGPVVGWLLIVPLLVLVSVAPTGLGAAAADRVEPYSPIDRGREFGPLPTDGPVTMKVFEFLDRALWDMDRSLEGVEVELEGLVVNDPSISDGFLLTRFMVSCCAADGLPMQVVVRNVSGSYANDTWVRARVIWIPAEGADREAPTLFRVEAEAVWVTVVPDPPDDPYESPY